MNVESPAHRDSGAPPSDAAEPPWSTERELLRLALVNIGRSTLLLLAAVTFVTWAGWNAGAQVGAALTAVLGAVSACWRWVVARRLLTRGLPTQDDVRRGVLHMEALSMMAGMVWVVASWSIYPRLSQTEAAAYVGIVVGSISLAASFWGLVGRAFKILAGLQVGAFAVVSFLGVQNASWPMGVLVLGFGLTMMDSARAFREATARGFVQRRDVQQANAALRTALDAAQAANIAKSQFLATMSHEIRTPMNGVLGALDLLRRTPLEPPQRRLVRTAAASGESLMSILNDVLDHSKVESGKLELVRAPMSLVAMASSAVALFRTNAEAKGLQMCLEIDPTVVDRVWGDSRRLKQVLLNLLGNAVKFTERGRVTLTVRGLASADIERARVSFIVSDTGIGMSDEDCRHIFQPFHQVAGPRYRRAGGTGLGLTISQRIVEAMGGRIEVHSEPGLGSTFEFTLDLEPDESSAPVPLEETQPMPLSGVPPLSGRVLVAEDNVVNRLIATEMLRNLGLTPLEAENGEQALQLLAQEPVDLVLMDVQMPVMDGYEATRTWRERESREGRRRVPIIAVTANVFGEDAAHAHDVGMDMHLAKPFAQEQLRALIAQVI